MGIFKKIKELSLLILPFYSKRRSFVKKSINIICKPHLIINDFIKILKFKEEKAFYKNKKTMLFIDKSLPEYDKDAGSRSVFNYLSYFCKINIKVKFIYDDFINNERYANDLRNIGIEVLDNPYFKYFWKKYLKKNKDYFDYVFLSRPFVADKYIDYIKKITKAKIFYLGHDLHYLRENRIYNLTKEKYLLQVSKIYKKIELSIVKKADISYFVSAEEIKILKEFDSSINCKIIPINIFPKKEIIQFDKNRKDLLFVGGFKHSPNTDAVLWFEERIFNKIKMDIQDIKLYIIGSNPPKEIKKLESSYIKILGHVNDDILDEYYKKCRICIAPLRCGAGVKGKIIEAMYRQIPVITTTIGAEGLKNIENCLVIEDEPEKFAEKLICMYNDYYFLSKLSMNGFNYINEYFTENNMNELIKEDF